MKPTIEQIHKAIAFNKKYLSYQPQNDTALTQLYALRVLKKLMEEPSKNMRIAADNSDQKDCLNISKRTINEMFKAMRDQLLMEVGEQP